ncbi:ABC transporter permease, partial [Aduncisulcus paluster]
MAVRTCLNVSRSLITELREGTLESLMLTPFSRYGYFAGNMLQQTVTSMGEIALAFILCMPFGFSAQGFSLPFFLLSLMASLVAFFGMSMMLGALMLYTRDTYISQNTLFIFMYLVS